MACKCQIKCLQRVAQPHSHIEELWQFRNRLKRMIKRRLKYLENSLSGMFDGRRADLSMQSDDTLRSLQPGDYVRVKSREQIQATLNRWNELKGCGFMEEMWAFCGTNQRVFKRVEKFLDERDYRIKKCNGIVILDRIICHGTIDFGRCDRACFFFWREEWLERVD